MKKELYKEGYTQNRELSWLHFDDRCLNEAKDKNVPLLERLKFISIYTSNMYEFFMVRVGGLYDMNKASYPRIDNKTGLTPKGQLDAIYAFAKRGIKKRDNVYADLRKKMNRAGIEDIALAECTKKELKFLRKYFKYQIMPLLSPQIIDSYHPFPNLQGGNIYVMAELKRKNKTTYGFVQVPKSIPVVIRLEEGKAIRFVHTEDVVEMFADLLFPNMIVLEKLKLIIARSAYVDADDEAFDEILDYKKKMLKVLKERRKMHVTIACISRKPSSRFRKYLIANLKIASRELFSINSPMDLSYAFSMQKYLNEEQKAKYLYAPYIPAVSPDISLSRKIFPQIQKKDILMSYPYMSMEPFLQLIKESAQDPSVVSIKITIYRLASHARLVDYLCLAAENGKEVDVLIELKARFDEQNNIDYSDRLEDAGCHVIYGFDGIKVHSKICLITKLDKNRKAEHVVLISTGNFNENTAKQYTDLAVMTANPKIIKDSVAFFQNMAVGNLEGDYKALAVAPVSLKKMILNGIDREIAKKEKGYIFAKINSLTDEEIIERLQMASKAGVKVEMIVRGISCLLPQVKGKTENIMIRSIVGRYLEHSRIYIFGQGASEKMYISSADWMTRNTERRVEIAMPVLDPSVRRQLHEYIDCYMQDNTKARILYPTGRYHKIPAEEEIYIAQDELMKKAYEKPKSTQRKKTL